MNHIEGIQRLRHEASCRQREIDRSCRMAQSSVHNVLARAKAAGRGWPLPERLDEPALHKRLYGRRALLWRGCATGPSRASSSCTGS